MAYQNPSQEEIREILRSSNVIAVVGLSEKPDRTSYMVAEAMQRKGYRIIPVNPVVAGMKILGETCYSSLKDVPEQVDIVNVFRRSEFCEPVAEEAVAIGAKTLWLQQGIINISAANTAAEGGLKVIMDACIKVADAVLLPGGK